MTTQKQFEATQHLLSVTKQVASPSNHFSENFWKTAKRRHCDARQNMRHLLDRYMKPHH